MRSFVEAINNGNDADAKAHLEAVVVAANVGVGGDLDSMRATPVHASRLGSPSAS